MHPRKLAQRAGLRALVVGSRRTAARFPATCTTSARAWNGSRCPTWAWRWNTARPKSACIASASVRARHWISISTAHRCSRACVSDHASHALLMTRPACAGLVACQRAAGQASSARRIGSGCDRPAQGLPIDARTPSHSRSNCVLQLAGVPASRGRCQRTSAAMLPTGCARSHTR